MTKQEKFMYEIIGKISNTNAPFVFKGALITKLVLIEYGYTDIERATKDIDANWIGEPPQMETLVETINKSLIDFQNELYAETSREYTEENTAGIKIIEKITGEKIITMDIDIKPVNGSKIYYFGEMQIKGVLANEIIADKISAISGKMVFRRAKDIVDIYALSHCAEIKITEIYNNSRKSGNEIKSFDEFYNRTADVEHAYKKLKNVEGKPDFDELYAYLKKFLQPFAENDMKNKIWNSNNLTWNCV